MIYKNTIITLMTIFSLMSVGLGQDCIDGIEVELWGECYNIEETTDLYLEGLFLGSIPPEIGQLVNLTSLGLINNQLTGEIPSEIGNLTNLEYLTLSNNQLSGGIPSSIGNLSKLFGLDLENNYITSLPESFVNLGNSLESIDYIILSNNQITN